MIENDCKIFTDRQRSKIIANQIKNNHLCTHISLEFSKRKFFCKIIIISKAKFLRFQNIVKNKYQKNQGNRENVIHSCHAINFTYYCFEKQLSRLRFLYFSRYFIMSNLRKFLRNCFFKFLGRKYHFCSKITQKLLGSDFLVKRKMFRFNFEMFQVLFRTDHRYSNLIF